MWFGVANNGREKCVIKIAVGFRPGDTIDALFWTATEPKDRRPEHWGLISHICSILMFMFQATILKVAVN